MIKIMMSAKPRVEKQFPKLMKSSKDDRIVFATGKWDGDCYEIVYISGFGEHLIGNVSSDFDLFNSSAPFEDYNEPITIQNA